jgi:glycosyltransferase involved in cell wall biosynthesis
VSSIAQALCRAIDQPMAQRKKVIAIGTQQVQKFSWQKTAAKLAAILIETNNKRLY